MGPWVIQRAYTAACALALTGCYMSHARPELPDANETRGLDASTPVDVGAGPDAGVDADIDIDAGIDAGRDAGVDAGTTSGLDAGVVWSARHCVELGQRGPEANGEPCEGSFGCTLDCPCSGASVHCDDGRVEVSGRCDPDACDVAGAWRSCEDYVDGGGAALDRCDPFPFGSCTASDGCCTREITCVLDGFVEETRDCSGCP